MRLKFTSIALLAVCSLTASATAPSLMDSTRKIYGYFNTESLFDGDHGYAWISTDHLDIPHMLYSFLDNSMGMVGMYAGAGLDGVIYGFDYSYNGNMGAPLQGNLVSYDINTGLYTVIAPWGDGVSNAHPQDATFDRSTGTMYALMGPTIYSVDLTDAKMTPVVTIQSDMGFVTLAADAVGEFYSIALDGCLYKIDKGTGVITKILETTAEGFYFQQSMEFDPTTGNIVWAANVASFNRMDMELVEIILNPGGEPYYEMNGTFGNDAVFNSLYIEGADSYAAPGNITDLTGTYDATTKSVTLTWTNPDKTFGGDELTKINGAEIFCNGESIKVLTDCQPGQTSTFTTTDVTMNAENRFSVILFGAGGNGMKAIVPVYVGNDMPAAVTGISIKGANDYSGAALSWDAVITGYHKGEFDAASVKYDVVRRPDNVEVAKGITATSFTDTNIRRTLNYYYDIIAYNEIGTAPAVASPNRILGPAFTCPFEENFDDNGAVLNHWMINDANGDYNTWMLSSSASTQFFGDAETGLEYMLSPAMGEFDDADEWFISGPIKFEAGKNYEIDLTLRSLMEEKLEIHFGKSEEPDEMELVKTLDIAESLYYEGDTHIRPSYYIQALPTNGEEMVASVALHLVTPNKSNYCFLQISDIAVVEQGTGSVSTVAASTVASRFYNGCFEVIGEFEKVEIFNIAGVKVLESAAAVTDMSAYEAGVYVAVITSAGGRTAAKFVK